MSTEAPISEIPAHDPWTQETRDRWFFGLLVASMVAVAVLFQPFVYVLGAGAVTVVVTWPIYQRILTAVNGKRALASVLSTLLIGVIIGGPLAFFVFLFVQQAITVVGQGVEFVNSGQMTAWLTWFSAADGGDVAGWVPKWASPHVSRLIPADLDVQKMVAKPLQDGSLTALNAFGGFVPTLVSSTLSAVFGAVIYVATVLSLYMEGPALLRVLRNLSPIEARYDRRLFEVFRELSNNMVVGTLAIAAIQAMFAGLGYGFCGVERALFFAILTGVCGFVPFVGTMAIWVPVVIYVSARYGLAWGGGLALWSMIVVGQIDNVLRPFFMRGNTNIHPLVVGLAAFGGIGWFGVPGLLVGPLIVAFFLALYTIFVEDFLRDRRAAAWAKLVQPSLTPATGNLPPAT